MISKVADRAIGCSKNLSLTARRSIAPLIVSVLFSGATGAFADANTVHTCTSDDGIKYYFTVSDDGYATIWRTAKGTYENGTWERLSVKPAPVGTFVIPERVWISETGTYSVRGIGQDALWGCAITNIVIPSCVSYIDGKGFRQCYGISNVYIASLESYLQMTFSYGGDGWFSQFGDSWRLFVRGNQTEEVKDLVVPDGTETIHDYAFRKCRSLETVTIPDSVTSIGEYAFWDCPNLRSVTLGEGVTNIAYSAFSGCTNLASISFPASLRTIGASAFHSCSSLPSLPFRDGLLSIGNNAFWGCSGLTSVAIPSSVTNIAIAKSKYDYHAFGECPNIVSVSVPNLYSMKTVFPDSYQSIRTATIAGGNATLATYFCSDCAALESATIAPGITSLGRYAFHSCSALSSVSLPAGLGDAGESAFSNCTNLTSVALPNTVTNIGIWAFAKSGIREMAFPEQLEKIADREAFLDCTSLTSITLPSALRYVGTSTFSGCSNLRCIHISDLAAFCDIDWAGSLPNHTLFLNGEHLDELVVPEGVSALKNHAFANSTNLTSVSIPMSVKSLSASSFSGCGAILSVLTPGELLSYQMFPSHSSITNITILPGSKTSGSVSHFSSITSIVIPDEVETIPAGALAYCTALQFVSIPHSVTNMGNRYIAEKSPAIRDVRIPTRWSAGDLFWYSKSAITNVVIVDGETEICDDCFNSFTSLQSVSIPETMTSIGYSAFSSCSSLKSVEIPNAVTNIGSYAFYCCRELESANIPNGVQSIKPYTFYVCDSLRSVTIPDSVTNIESCAFHSCTGIAELTVPQSVSTLDKDAFQAWTADQTIRLPAKFSGVVSLNKCSADIHYYGNVPAGPDGDVPIPCEWVDAYVPNASRNYASAVNTITANGRPLWECYVAGTDPTDPASAFTASITFDAATGDPVIGWSPELSAAEAAKRTYTVFGKVHLNDADWTAVDGDAADYNFFKVRVEMK